MLRFRCALFVITLFGWLLSARPGTAAEKVVRVGGAVERQQQMGCLSAPDGLNGWWPGDGDAQDLAMDNHGEARNDAAFTDGIVGEAFDARGRNAHFEVSDDPALDLTETGTVASWVYVSPVQPGEFPGFLTKGPPTQGIRGAHNYYLALMGRQSSCASARSVPGGWSGPCTRAGVTGIDLIDPDALSPRQWHYVALTWDGSMAALYVDAVMKASASQDGPGRPNDDPLRIGARPLALQGAGDSIRLAEFSGMVDEVELYDRALAAEEIEAIFEAGENGKCKPSPVRLTANLNAASFEGDAATGSLASFFGEFPGVALAVAAGIPLPLELANVSMLFFSSAQQGLAVVGGSAPDKAQVNGVAAPLLFVSENQINLQIPWEVAGFGDNTTAIAMVDGVASDPMALPQTPVAPAVFTFDFGPGRAVAINSDSTVAHAEGSFGSAVASRPVAAGEGLVLLATGLGPTVPPALTGEDSLDDQGAFVRRDTLQTPRVLIGDNEQQVLFSGMSPQFVGVQQINVLVAEGTPSGDAVSLVLDVGGVVSRSDVTVAVGE